MGGPGGGARGLVGDMTSLKQIGMLNWRSLFSAYCCRWWETQQFALFFSSILFFFFLSFSFAPLLLFLLLLVFLLHFRFSSSSCSVCPLPPTRVRSFSIASCSMSCQSCRFSPHPATAEFFQPPPALRRTLPSVAKSRRLTARSIPVVKDKLCLFFFLFLSFFLFLFFSFFPLFICLLQGCFSYIQTSSFKFLFHVVVSQRISAAPVYSLKKLSL